MVVSRQIFSRALVAKTPCPHPPQLSFATKYAPRRNALPAAIINPPLLRYSHSTATSEGVKGAQRSTEPLPRNENVGAKRFADFDLLGKTYLVTGGARGLGLALAEALVEAGGKGEFKLWMYAHAQQRLLTGTSILPRPRGEARRGVDRGSESR